MINLLQDFEGGSHFYRDVFFAYALAQTVMTIVLELLIQMVFVIPCVTMCYLKKHSILQRGRATIIVLCPTKAVNCISQKMD